MMKYGGSCGLDCDECPALLATKADDREALKRIAAEWSKLYGVEIPVEKMPCAGCFARPPEPLGCHAPDCEIRACVIGRGYKTCAECPDFACEIIAGLLAQAPEAKQRLEELRG